MASGQVGDLEVLTKVLDLLGTIFGEEEQVDQVLLDYLADIIVLQRADLKQQSDLVSVVSQYVDSSTGWLVEGCGLLWDSLLTIGVLGEGEDTVAYAAYAQGSPTLLPQPVKIDRPKFEKEGGDITQTSYVMDVEDKPLRMDEHEDDQDEFVPGVDGCAMCLRPMPLTRHHLIPRTLHRAYKKKGYEDAVLGVCVNVCRPCHNAIHRIFDEKTLGAEYNTLEKLMTNDEVQKFVGFISKQKLRAKSDPRLNPSLLGRF